MALRQLEEEKRRLEQRGDETGRGRPRFRSRLGDAGEWLNAEAGRRPAVVKSSLLPRALGQSAVVGAPAHGSVRLLNADGSSIALAPVDPAVRIVQSPGGHEARALLRVQRVARGRLARARRAAQLAAARAVVKHWVGCDAHLNDFQMQCQGLSPRTLFASRAVPSWSVSPQL